MVALLRPGVGEVDMETFHGAVGDRAGQKVCGISADEPDVGQAPSADAVNGVSEVSAGSLDADEIDVRHSRRLVEKKRRLAGANLDMDGAATSENFGKIDFAVQIFGLQPNQRIVF